MMKLKLEELREKEAEIDIYTTVTKELKQREFGNFEEKLKLQKQEWDKKINSEEEDEQ